MNEYFLILLCAFGTTIIACIFDYLYFSRRYKELEEKIVPNIYILEEDMKMLKKETTYINGRISKIDKNIIYVEKGE